MEPTPQLIDELFREQVRMARAMPPEEKLLEGPRLFDRSCRIMLVGIRDQYPGVGAAEAMRILIERLDRLERLEASA